MVANLCRTGCAPSRVAKSSLRFAEKLLSKHLLCEIVRIDVLEEP